MAIKVVKDGRSIKNKSNKKQNKPRRVKPFSEYTKTEKLMLVASMMECSKVVPDYVTVMEFVWFEHNEEEIIPIKFGAMLYQSDVEADVLNQIADECRPLGKALFKGYRENYEKLVAIYCITEETKVQVEHFGLHEEELEPLLEFMNSLYDVLLSAWSVDDVNDESWKLEL